MKDYYLLKREDGKYVSQPGFASSYTTSIRFARKFTDRHAANANACENERVVSLAHEVGVEE